ncbi:MAG: hypothetical protein ACI31S_05250 [Bacilli bacterium]
MNEEEMMQRKKIEKREKVDMVIAYILLVVLLLCILVVIYLKFIRKEEDNLDSEHTPTVITLSDISNSLNNSNLAKNYSNDGALFSASTSDDLLMINYAKDTNNINMNIPLNTNELVVTLNSDNSLIGEDVYKEIANVICTFYGNDVNLCRSTIDKVSTSSPIDGIRFVSNGDTTTVYIDVMKKIKVDSSIIYNEVTKVSLNEYNYVLNFDDITISDIYVSSTDTNLTFIGKIETTLVEPQMLSVVVKLYDNSGNVIEENKYEYTSDNLLNKEGNFDISFILSDSLTKENISKYTIEILR